MKFIKDHSSTTAILLFAQSEKVQSISKSIACKKKQNQLLWKKMNENVLKTIKKTNLPYSVVDESIQVGNTFGEKITDAINKVFAQGHDKVIVIGNDCIELQANHLLLANTNLQINDSVLEADFNGGAYLIAVSKSSFLAKQFAAISWQTPCVFKELKALFSKKKMSLLPVLNDCNSAFDFKKAICKLSFSDGFKNLILSLLQKGINVNYYKKSQVHYEYKSLNLNKGSPFSL
ncbi:DUF2064 domain-containing protein [Flavobacterium sp. RSP49]|uniref:DUF2064 domain-containing protein n=2 Tax=unclassified Flavobacterium TaxID=196869 RepID=UPI000F81762F|nr:DUF2064 domain-containing protein [Flavobacterium sp. RSP49]RTZ03297.1 DUF2064 domain-containing protein [Flavobacterium sp. RSP49]